MFYDLVKNIFSSYYWKSEDLFTLISYMDRLLSCIFYFLSLYNSGLHFLLEPKICNHKISRIGIYVQQCAVFLLAPTGALVLMMVYYISAARQLFQIFTQSLDAIDVTSVTLKRFNADDVTRYFGDILGIF